MMAWFIRLAFAGLTAGILVHGAVRGDSAMYVGGTTSIEENTKGRIDTSDTARMFFNSKKGQIDISYGSILTLEYGQKAGRRVGVALAVSPLALFSKKRKHYLTIGYTDASGNRQGAVFEIAKGRVGTVVRVLETRSGKTVEFESEEARKHFEKGNR